MKPTPKKIWIISLVVLGLISAFGCGTFFGIKFAYKLYKPSFEAENYFKTRWAQIALKKIDENEIKKGHNLILVQVNSGIITLDNIIENVEEKEMKDRIQRLLRSIAIHREKYPKYYDVDENFLPETSKTTPQINEILEKYKTKS